MRKPCVVALAGACLAAAVLAPNAGAEPHAGHMEPRGGLAPGYVVPVLPPDYLVVNARNGRLFFQAGV
jgi:hypothetical protein